MCACRVKGSYRGCIFLVRGGKSVGVEAIYTGFIQTSHWPLVHTQSHATQDWGMVWACMHAFVLCVWVLEKKNNWNGAKLHLCKQIKCCFANTSQWMVEQSLSSMHYLSCFTHWCPGVHLQLTWGIHPKKMCKLHTDMGGILIIHGWLQMNEHVVAGAVKTQPLLTSSQY